MVARDALQSRKIRNSEDTDDRSPLFLRNAFMATSDPRFSASTAGDPKRVSALSTVLKYRNAKR